MKIQNDLFESIQTGLKSLEIEAKAFFVHDF
jgi:hypothetical protein